MKCDCCGQLVKLHNGDEGTNSYTPIERARIIEMLLAEAKFQRQQFSTKEVVILEVIVDRIRALK